MNKKKTLLFITPRLPFPPTSGRKNSLYHYCEILSKKLDFRLIVASFLEIGDNPSLKPDFIDKLVILQQEKKIKKAINIVVNSFIKKDLPIQTSLYLSDEAERIITEIIETENVDVIISDMVRTTEYLKNKSIYKIADLDDRISLRYKRQFTNDKRNMNPYGAFLDGVPNIVQKIILYPPIKSYVIKLEIDLLEKYEREIALKTDRTILVAESECKQLNQEISQNKAFPIPIGIETKYIEKNYEYDNKEDIIGFLGAMNVAHNENAVINFVENIFPIILKEKPNAKFMVIGGNPSDALLKYKNQNVNFTGYVNEVSDFLKLCKVFVCPMTFGSGIKTKNLEAMSLGIPVVTTTIGAENIGAIDKIDWFIEDDFEKFAQVVKDLLDSSHLCSEIGRNGSNYVKENFTWDKVEQRFRELMRQIEREEK